MHTTASPITDIQLALAGLLVLACTTGPLAAQEIVRPESALSRDSSVGRLFQIIDAVPLRGEEIRLRVALRVEETEIPQCGPQEAEPGEVVGASDDCESGAFGWLRIDGQPAAGPGEEYRTMRVATSQWSVEEVRTRVPNHALDLLFGVLLEGDGPMWADDVQLAVRRPDGVWRRLAIPNADCESVAGGGRPAAWGGIDPAWEAQIDRDGSYEGSGAIRIARVRAVPSTE